MRDQDLVFRAERAATALEEAWIRWRGRHGLGTGPMPPVSSYVGYSVDEPWGQARVVFGIEAGEAERLAAILDRYEFAGPVEAEVSAQPDRQRADSAPSAWTVPAGSPDVPALAGQLDRAPARSAGPEETIPRNPTPSQPGPPARTAPAAHPAQPPAAVGHPVPSAPAEQEGPLPPAPAEQEGPLPPAPADQDRPAPADQDRPAAAVPDRPLPSAPAVPDRPVPPQAGPADAMQPGPGAFATGQEPPPADPADAAAEDLTAEQPVLPRALRQAAAVADLPAELPDNEAAYLQELAARTVARPGIVALRPRPAGQPAASPAPESAKAPWQTVPDLGQPAEPGPGQAAGLGSPHRDMAPAVTGDKPAAGDDLPVARLLPVSRLNRSRTPADTSQWTAVDEPKHAPTDTAV
jgi:hypothetical protein